jgi:hypothetical protein
VLPKDEGAAEWVVSRIREMQPAPGDQSLAPAAAAGTAWDATTASMPAIRYKTNPERRLDFALYELPPRGAPPIPFGRRESGHVADLAFWDVPGEVYTGAIPDEIVEELTRASGLVLLIDPGFRPREEPATYYMRFFNRTLGTIQRALERASASGADVAYDARSRQITYPVVICLSKADQYPDAAGRDPKEWFESIVGPSAQMLYGWLRSSHVMSISATGRPLERVGGRDVMHGPPTPLLVLDPIDWILRHGGRRA